MACVLFGYNHSIDYRTIIDENLIMVKSDLDALKNVKVGETAQGEASKFFKKLKQNYNTRRLLVGHMFSNLVNGQWHFFYFDQRDYDENNNHWKKGSHIHFVNYLWSQYTRDSLLVQFLKSNPNIQGSYHIRWNETLN